MNSFRTGWIGGLSDAPQRPNLGPAGARKPWWAAGGSRMVGLPRLIEQGIEEPLFAGANGALEIAQRFWKVMA